MHTSLKNALISRFNQVPHHCIEYLATWNHRGIPGAVDQKPDRKYGSVNIVSQIGPIEDKIQGSMELSTLFLN